MTKEQTMSTKVTKSVLAISFLASLVAGRARWGPAPTAPSARNMRRTMRSLRSAGRLRPPSRRRPAGKTPGIMSAGQNPPLRRREASSAWLRPVGTSARCAGRS